jgi:3-hydroxybutyryl-CoA dehydrogenase
MKISAIGVVGAGVMGSGLAQNLAQTGHQVILVDHVDDALGRARTEITNNLRLQKMLNPASARERVPSILDRITYTTEYERLVDADFIIENITENWAQKKPAWQLIDSFAPERCVMAANTSAISITRIASTTRRADRILGMHFMNPVPLKEMVEVIRGYHTSDETLEVAQTLLKQMQKSFVVVRDTPGFVSNRVLMLMVNEAIFLVQDGVASVEQVDTIFRGCFGHKMGPLETADLIGLDTILYSIEVLYESFADSKYRPCPLLKTMVDAGLHGRKSGRGFYHYNSTDDAEVSQ